MINQSGKSSKISIEEGFIKALAIEILCFCPPERVTPLSPIFVLEELKEFGRIYMYRYRPDYEMKARNIEDYPGKSNQAKAIMLMIQNNLDYAVAQHPHELITYGGNGGVFQN